MTAMLKGRKRAVKAGPPVAKKFVIPRKSSETQPIAQKPLDSRESVELIRIVQASFVNPSFPLNITRVQLVNNEKMRSEFSEKRKLLKDEGRILSELVEIYGFRLFSRASSTACAQKGLLVSQQRMSFYTLGDPKYGVYLSRAADLLTKRSLDVDTDLYMVVFKVLKGRVKVLTEQIDSLENLMEPTPNYDGHFSKEFPNLSQSSATASQMVDSAQMYLYEFELDNVGNGKYGSLYARRPRQCLPHAIVTFRYVPKATIVAPMETRGRPDLAEVEEAKKATESSKPQPTCDDDAACASPGPEEHVLWNGSLYNKDRFLANVNIISYSVSSFVLPLAGPSLSISSTVKLSSLRALLPQPIFKKPPAVSRSSKVTINGVSYLCCCVTSTDEQCPVVDMLVSHLSRKQQAVVLEFSAGSSACFLPTSNLTEQLGITVPRATPLLNVLFIDKDNSSSGRCQASRAFYQLQQRMLDSRIASIESMKAKFFNGMPMERMNSMYANIQSSGISFSRPQLEQIPKELTVMCKTLVAQLAPNSSATVTAQLSLAQNMLGLGQQASPLPSAVDVERVAVSDAASSFPARGHDDGVPVCDAAIPPRRSDFDFSYGNHFADVYDPAPVATTTGSLDNWGGMATVLDPSEAGPHQQETAWGAHGVQTFDVQVEPPYLLDLRPSHSVVDHQRLALPPEAVHPSSLLRSVPPLEQGDYGGRGNEPCAMVPWPEAYDSGMPQGHENTGAVAQMKADGLPPWFETELERVHREGYDRKMCLTSPRFTEEIARKYNLLPSSQEEDNAPVWPPYHDAALPAATHLLPRPRMEDDYEIPVVTMYQSDGSSYYDRPLLASRSNQVSLPPKAGAVFGVRNPLHNHVPRSPRLFDPRRSAKVDLPKPGPPSAASSRSESMCVKPTPPATEHEAASKTVAPPTAAGHHPVAATVSLKRSATTDSVQTTKYSSELTASASNGFKADGPVNPLPADDQTAPDTGKHYSDMELSSLTSDDEDRLVIATSEGSCSEGSSRDRSGGTQKESLPVRRNKRARLSAPSPPPATGMIAEPQPPLPPIRWSTDREPNPPLPPPSPTSDARLKPPLPNATSQANHDDQGERDCHVKVSPLQPPAPPQASATSRSSDVTPISLQQDNGKAKGAEPACNGHPSDQEEPGTKLSVDRSRSDATDERIVLLTPNEDDLSTAGDDAGSRGSSGGRMGSLCVTVIADAAIDEDRCRIVHDGPSTPEPPSASPRLIISASSARHSPEKRRLSRKRPAHVEDSLSSPKRHRSLSPISLIQRCSPRAKPRGIQRWDSSSSLHDPAPQCEEVSRDLRDVLRQRGLNKEPPRTDSPTLCSADQSESGHDDDALSDDRSCTESVSLPRRTERLTIERRWSDDEDLLDGFCEPDIPSCPPGDLRRHLNTINANKTSSATLAEDEAIAADRSVIASDDGDYDADDDEDGDKYPAEDDDRARKSSAELSPIDCVKDSANAYDGVCDGTVSEHDTCQPSQGRLSEPTALPSAPPAAVLGDIAGDRQTSPVSSCSPEPAYDEISAEETDPVDSQPQFEQITDEEDNAGMAATQNKDKDTRKSDDLSKPDSGSVAMDISPGRFSNVSDFGEEWEVVSADVSPSHTDAADLVVVHRDRLPSIDDSVLDPHRLMMRAKAESRVYKAEVESQPSQPDAISEPADEVVQPEIFVFDQLQQGTHQTLSVTSHQCDIDARDASGLSAMVPSPSPAADSAQGDSSVPPLPSPNVPVVGSEDTASVGESIARHTTSSKVFATAGTCGREEGAPAGSINHVDADPPERGQGDTDTAPVETAPGEAAQLDAADNDDVPSALAVLPTSGQASSEASTKVISLTALSVCLMEFQREWTATHPRQRGICSEFVAFFQDRVLK